MKKKQRKIGIIAEVAVLFLIGVVATGFLTNISQQRLSGDAVTRQTEQYAAEMAEEVRLSVTELPAYRWLLRYWYTHADTLDVEYDADFSGGTRTEEKSRALTERHPELQLRYLTEKQLSALPAEDQKLCAEIIYSWLITRVDQIKRTYHIDYLFCVASKAPFNTQFFLFSGADEGSVRGTDYEEVYPLGHCVNVSESQRAAMVEARDNLSHLADAGDYVDYYTYLCSFDGYTVFIGLTYGLSDLRADVEARTRTGTAYAILNQIFLSLLCLCLIYFFVLRPLRGVQKNIRLYRSTKDSRTVAENLSRIRPHNEIGQLSEDVSDLAKEIDSHLESIRAITAEKERIGTELELAARIQAHMLPNVFPAFPNRREFDVYARMDPAKAVGGDFYDFFLVDDDHLCILIADVSGKGVPAALFMMASQIVLSNNAKSGKSPAQILTDANAAICANNREEMFVTVWLGILEISTGKVTAANAGHERPALTRDGRFTLLSDRHGLVVGAMETAKYTEYEFYLKPGERLFLFTDGVPEATDAAGAMFGTDRMLDALNADPAASPEQILNNVRAAVDGFVQGAEQFDDLTMLCLEVKETGKPRFLTVPAEKSQLSRVSGFVEDFLDEVGCPLRTRMQIALTVEEIFVNIASYAYPEGAGEARIDVAAENGVLTLTFADGGVAYDPTEKPDPDLTLSAEKRQIGGLGVYLVKKTMDSVSYRRENGQNILTVTKKINGRA